jgi:hypothetical protein
MKLTMDTKSVAGKLAAAAGVVALSCGVWGLAGCTMGQIQLSGAAASGGGATGMKITGGVHGGEQPVIGATLQLYAAGAPAMPVSGSSTGGYGQGAVSLIPAGSMTVSSSNNYFPGGASGCTYTTGNTNACTALPQTDSTGSFSITGDYTCPATASQIYMVATGGNPGGGTSNPAIALMAGLGTCAANGNLGASRVIDVDEVTTVATVWALQQFMAAPTGTAASAYASQGGATSGVGVNIGAPSGPVGGYGASAVQTSVIGQQNAFAMINNLTDTSVGSSGAGSAGTAANSWATPWAAKINTIADILAYCVNSASSCSTLMADATPTSSTAAADTIQAAYYMARNPANNVATLFGLITGTPPFAALGTAPNDWGIFVGIAPTFAAGGNAVASAYSGAFDEYGHLWLTNINTTTAATPFVSELGGDGSVIGGPFGNPASATQGGAFTAAHPYTSNGGYVDTTMTCTTTATHTLAYATSGPKAIVVDLANTVWTNNPDETACVGSVKTLMRITGSSGYSPTSSGWAAPAMGTGYFINGTTYSGLAADSNDNVYISTSGSTSHQVEFQNGSGTYSSGGTLGASSPSATVIDNSASGSGPYIWTVGSKDCSSPQGQIYQQPLSAFVTTASVQTYQNSTCTSGTFGANGTVVNIGAAMQLPFAAAVDKNNYIWSTNSVANTVNLFVPNTSGVLDTTANTTVTSTSGLGGVALPYGVAVDGSNQAWIASSASANPYYVAVLKPGSGSPASIVLSPLLTGAGSSNLGFTTTSSSLPFTHGPRDIEIDPSGNVWFMNNSSSTAYQWVTVLVGQATPVITPKVLALKATMIGQEPQ